MKWLGARGKTPPRKRLFNAAVHIGASSLLSFLIMCVVWPDLFVDHTISFIRFGDYEFNFTAVSALISNMYNGGIQLWNNYDQMPLAYYHLTGGFYTYSNLATAVVYALLSPFFKYPGQALHVIFSIFFFAVSIPIRAAGTYLLLKRLGCRPAVVFFGSVLASTLLSTHLYLGLNCASLYSFFPLVMYFGLRLFEKWSLNRFLFFVGILGVAISFDPMVGLMYFYQALHFFLLCGLIWSIWMHRKAIKEKWRKPSFPSGKKAWGKIALVGVIGVLSFAPWLTMLKVNFPDYEMAQKGSRFENMASIQAYFDRPVFFAPQDEFLPNIVNFAANNWAISWLYLGYSTVFLVLAGLILRKDSRKYIFVCAIALLFLINSYRIPLSIGGIAHWINALTNPFKFLPRSFHMAGAFPLPYFFLPLMGMGAEALATCLDRVGDRKKLFGLFLVTLIYLGFVFDRLPDVAKHSLLVCFLLGSLALAALSLVRIPRKARAALLVAFGFSILLKDFDGLSRFYIPPFSAENQIMPHQLDGLGELNPVFVDYLNPKTLPFRIFFSGTGAGIPNSVHHDNNPINMNGLIYRYSNIFKYFYPPHNYRPRHLSYTPLTADTSLQAYVIADQRTIAGVDFATLGNAGSVYALVQSNLSERIIALDEPSREQGPMVENPSSPIPPDSAGYRWAWQSGDVPLCKGTPLKVGAWEARSFDLPPGFPAYRASAIYTEDRNAMKVSIDDFNLHPVQGWFAKPFTYDVQNLQEGKLFVALPDSYDCAGKTLRFRFLQPLSGIMDIWKNHPDSLGFDYLAKNDQWIMFHLPFDEKWKVTVDGGERSITKANKMFFTVPVTAGKHKVLLEYWPQTPLRALILIACVLNMLSLAFLMTNALRNEGKDAAHGAS